jgi:hypothetical protein
VSPNTRLGCRQGNIGWNGQGHDEAGGAHDADGEPRSGLGDGVDAEEH